MATNNTAVLPATSRGVDESGVFAILVALSASHMLNDIMQALLPAMYPVLQKKYELSYTQVGLITFAFQCTASFLQPIVGMATDRKAQPFSLAIGMVFTLVGLLLLSRADSFGAILVSGSMIGIGSAVFHPEASRVARMASGGRHGFAQSLFQVGGNAGTAIGPLLVAAIIVPLGQGSTAWFSLLAVLAIVVLAGVGRWYQQYLAHLKAAPKKPRGEAEPSLSRARVIGSVGILLLLVFSKYFYMVSLHSFYSLYLTKHFGVSEAVALNYLAVFLGAVAVGTLAGGPIGDRFGFKTVIWGSILGVLPFTLALPYANLFWTVWLTIPIGMILASAFSAIIVYAQELVPSRVGMVAGLFFGFAFGMSGIGAAVLGWLADRTSLEFVYTACSYLPLLGILTVFLPNLHRHRAKAPA